MSTLEPQTTAKVRLETTKGFIDIELWAKETPITSRIFLTNVLNGRFDGWEFSRIVKDFLVQIDGNLNQVPFEDEFNTRIRFSKRGILGSVNMGSRNSNTGKFFITLKESPELQSRNTAFGKVVGDGVYTVLKISEGELMEYDDETPKFPVKIKTSQVIIPYFDDLVKQEITQERVAPSSKKIKKKKKGRVLNLAEEDEGEVLDIKIKSAHDVLNDDRLLRQDTVVMPNKSIESSTNEEITKDSDCGSQLNGVNAEIEQLKSCLDDKDGDRKGAILQEEREVSLKDLSRIPKTLSKEERELETLKLLEVFQKKMNEAAHKSSVSKSGFEQAGDTISDGFDNLDNESDSEIDLYSHSLNFEDNAENNMMVNEDLLVTIDGKTQNQLRNKRDNEFYRHLDSGSNISKKKRTK